MLIVFFVLAFVAVGTAISMLVTRNAVYSAMFLVLNFATVAVFFLLLNAPFIAVAQVSVVVAVEATLDVVVPEHPIFHHRDDPKASSKISPRGQLPLRWRNGSTRELASLLWSGFGEFLRD